LPPMMAPEGPAMSKPTLAPMTVPRTKPFVYFRGKIRTVEVAVVRAEAVAWTVSRAEDAEKAEDADDFRGGEGEREREGREEGA